MAVLPFFAEKGTWVFSHNRRVHRRPLSYCTLLMAMSL